MHFGRRILFAFSLLSVLCLFGCMNRVENDMEQNMLEINEDADTLYDIQKDEQFEFVSVNIKDGKTSYSYNGEKVIINYQYTAYEETSFGLMVLCDGIAVPFSTNKTAGDATLQIIPNDNNDTMDVAISFTPLGKKGDTVSIEIVDIVEPDFDVTRLELNGNILPLIYGKKYKVAYISDIWVTMNEDGLENIASISEKNDYIELSVEEKKEYNESRDMNSFWAEYKINEEESILYSVKQGDILEVDITYTGTEGQDVFTSFYIDNELFSVFDKEDYSKCYVDGNHKTIIKGKIDTSNLEEGIHIVYSVCGNIKYGNYNPTKAFIIEVK